MMLLHVTFKAMLRWPIHRCKNCGITTHWWSIDRDDEARMAVNMRLLTAKDLQHYRIRHFDGADSRKFID